MHNEYVGILPGKNMGDIWEKGKDGKYVCSTRAFKLSEKAIQNDLSLGYLKPLKKHRLIYITSEVICFVYDDQGYKISRTKWDLNKKLDDCWPAANSYIRIIGHLAVGIFQDFFDTCKYDLALA